MQVAVNFWCVPLHLGVFRWVFFSPSSWPAFKMGGLPTPGIPQPEFRELKSADLKSPPKLDSLVLDLDRVRRKVCYGTRL